MFLRSILILAAFIVLTRAAAWLLDRATRNLEAEEATRRLLREMYEPEQDNS